MCNDISQLEKWTNTFSKLPSLEWTKTQVKKQIINGTFSNMSKVESWQKTYSRPLPISLSKGNLLTTLNKVSKEFRVSFGFNPTSYTARHKSVLHLSTGQARDKMPELTVSSVAIKVESKINGRNVKKFFKPPPPKNQWTRIQIQQQIRNGKYEFSVDFPSS